MTPTARSRLALSARLERRRLGAARRVPAFVARVVARLASIVTALRSALRGAP
jgi:hypothetical protein